MWVSLRKRPLRDDTLPHTGEGPGWPSLDARPDARADDVDATPEPVAARPEDRPDARPDARQASPRTSH